MQFGRGNVLPLSDPTDEVTVFVEEYVAERGTTSEVVNVGVEVRLLIVASETRRATGTP